MSMSLNNTTNCNNKNNSPTSPHRAYGRPLASRSRSLLVSSELLQPEVEVEPTLRGSGSYMNTTTNSFANANANAVPTVHRTTTTTTAPSSESSLSSSSSFPRINEARKQRTKEDTTLPPNCKLALVSDDLEPPSFDEERFSYMYSRATGSLLRTSEVDQWEALPEILRVEDDDEGAGTEGGAGSRSGYKKDKGKNRAVDGFSKSFSSRHSGKPSERDVPRPLPLPSSSSYASSSSRRQHDNSSHHYEALGSFDYNVDPTRLSALDQSMFESSRTMSRSTPPIRPGNIGPEAEAEPEAPTTPAISALPIPAFKGFQRQQQQPTGSSSIRNSPPFPPTPKSMTMPMPIRVSTPVVVPSVVPASNSRARSNSSVTFMRSDRGLGLRAASSSSSSFGMARSSSSMSVPRAPRSNFKPISGVGERARAASVASVSSTPFTSASRPESRFSSRGVRDDVPKTVFTSAASSARPPTSGSESTAFFWNKNPNNSESSTNSSSDLQSSTNDTDTDIEPNEAWKEKLRENIQRRVNKIKAQKRASHATFMQGIVNEEDRRRFRWEYEQSLSRPQKEFNIGAWAQYQYQTELDLERERRRVRILGEQRHRGIIGDRGEVQYKLWIPVSTARSA